jgi:hypothetical protein
MFREMQYMDHSLGAMDLAETMDQRRNQLISTTRRPSLVDRLARRASAPAVSTENSPVGGCT